MSYSLSFENAEIVWSAMVRRAVQELRSQCTGETETQRQLHALYAFTRNLPLARITQFSRILCAELDTSARTASVADQTRCALSWLDLCSGNGFERERCIRTIDGAAPSAFFFALVLQRLNDWVPQVRTAAREQVRLIAAATPCQEVVQALSACLLNVESLGRMSTADREALFQLLELPGVADGIAQATMSTETGPVSRVLVQACRSPAMDSRLIRIAQDARQPAARATAWLALINGRLEWTTRRQWIWTEKQWCKGRFVAVTESRPLTVPSNRTQHLEWAAQDPSAYVRRTAAGLLIKHLDEIDRDVATVVARKLAADSWPLVAERGRYALRQLASAP